jgi:hypothetical protein
VLLEALRVANPGRACAGKISYRDQYLKSFISKDDEAAVTSVLELLPLALYLARIELRHHTFAKVRGISFRFFSNSGSN